MLTPQVECLARSRGAITTQLPRGYGGNPAAISPQGDAGPFGAVLFLLALAGCGERQETRDAARVNPRFNGDRPAWEHAIDARAQLQNEYQRMR